VRWLGSAVVGPGAQVAHGLSGCTCRRTQLPILQQTPLVGVWLWLWLWLWLWPQTEALLPALFRVPRSPSL